MRACALFVLSLFLVPSPAAAMRDSAHGLLEESNGVEESNAVELKPLAEHGHALLTTFAKEQANLTQEDVTKILEKDKVLASLLQEHMQAEAAGETKNKLTRNDFRQKLLLRSSAALQEHDVALDESTGGKTQCMCALQHYMGREMVDLETKYDYTTGPYSHYSNGKAACAGANHGMLNDCIFRCHSDRKYGLDWQEGAMLGVDRMLPMGMEFTASRCNRDGRCECVDVSETKRKVRQWFGGHANLINDHPYRSEYNSPQECLMQCDCADGGGVDQEGICIDEFNPSLVRQAKQYQYRTAPQYSFDQ